VTTSVENCFKLDDERSSTIAVESDVVAFAVVAFAVEFVGEIVCDDEYPVNVNDSLAVTFTVEVDVSFAVAFTQHIKDKVTNPLQNVLAYVIPPAALLLPVTD
jgi:hypothetical protein